MNNISFAWGPRHYNVRREAALIEMEAEGYSYSEIGKKLKMSRSAVAGALWRYRRRREILRGASGKK